ncbi:hypothetical protein ACEQPO_21485 [Bacillus sp. SL00103]
MMQTTNTLSLQVLERSSSTSGVGTLTGVIEFDVTGEVLWGQ